MANNGYGYWLTTQYPQTWFGVVTVDHAHTRSMLLFLYRDPCVRDIRQLYSLCSLLRSVYTATSLVQHECGVQHRGQLLSGMHMSLNVQVTCKVINLEESECMLVSRRQRGWRYQLDVEKIQNVLSRVLWSHVRKAICPKGVMPVFTHHSFDGPPVNRPVPSRSRFLQ